VATKRKKLSKKTRFEVFKRDQFKCQYCGATAPEVVLVVDHIDPISKGGADEIINFITACEACNAGKSDRKLSDQSAVQKQRAQLEELAERREQLEMMLEWRNGLATLDEDAIRAICDQWKTLTKGQFFLNESGQQNARKLLAKYSLGEILDAMKVAAVEYMRIVDGKFDHDSVNLAWSKVKGIAHNKKSGIDRHVYYVRAIVRNRLTYCNEWMALDLIKEASQLGASEETLKSIAVNATSWTDWKGEMNELLVILKDEGI
jgi:hypothetical protein